MVPNKTIRARRNARGLWLPGNCLETGKPHRNGKGGRYCKKCKRIWLKKHYKNNKKHREKQLQRSRDSVRTNERQAQEFIARLKRYFGFPDAKLFKCDDCGKKAQVYDHRDYDFPEEVVPVCRACNRKRGPGKNQTIINKE